MCSPGWPKSEKVLPSAGSSYPVPNSAPSQAARETRRESSSMLAGGASATIWDDSGPVSGARKNLANSTRVPPMYIRGTGLFPKRGNRVSPFLTDSGKNAKWGRTATSSTSVSKTSPSQAARETRYKPRQVRPGGAAEGSWRGLWRVSLAVARRRRRRRRVRMYVYRGGGGKTAFSSKNVCFPGSPKI